LGHLDRHMRERFQLGKFPQYLFGAGHESTNRIHI
jgi:hypothetical protein